MTAPIVDLSSDSLCATPRGEATSRTWAESVAPSPFLRTVFAGADACDESLNMQDLKQEMARFHPAGCGGSRAARRSRAATAESCQRVATRNEFRCHRPWREEHPLSPIWPTRSLQASIQMGRPLCRPQACRSRRAARSTQPCSLCVPKPASQVCGAHFRSSEMPQAALGTTTSHSKRQGQTACRVEGRDKHLWQAN